MTLRIRTKAGSFRNSMPFAASGWVHGFLLAYVALSPGGPPKPRSVYEQQIEPNQKHLIWYNLRDKLPDIGASSARKSPQPPRAREKFNQTIVAGQKDLPGPRQMIVMPAPEIKLPDPLPLPNAVAVAPPPRPVKAFTAPVMPKAATVPLPLPDAPRVAPKVEDRKLPIEARVAKPQPRDFKAPSPVRPKPASIAPLPDAPSITAATRPATLPLPVPDPRAPRRGFTPPPVRPYLSADVPIPDAPTVATAVRPGSLPLPASDPRAPRRAFTPPAMRQKAAADGDPSLPDAPNINSAVQARTLPLAVPDPRVPARAFSPPPSGRPPKTYLAAELPSAPEISAPAPSAPSSEASLAIVGMNPTKAPDFVPPQGSRQAGFSAGPVVRPKGGDGALPGDSIIEVPGLLVRGGEKDKQPTLVTRASSPTSRENLMAAARAALGTTLPAGEPPPANHPGATRVTTAPDPRLDGRAVYTVAIQMPNITSYSGSWIVWFAEHQPTPGSHYLHVTAPVPLRKVDPKYIPAAAAEKVEGVVRLFAVIRKTGRVDSVALVRHLDDRLDRTAQEALSQWVFQPALLDGVPMDVDAVFEIPFRLAPVPLK